MVGSIRRLARMIARTNYYAIATNGPSGEVEFNYSPDCLRRHPNLKAPGPFSRLRNTAEALLEESSEGRVRIDLAMKR